MSIYILSVKSLLLGEAKMLATTIKVVNNFRIPFSQAICSFSKRLYRKLGYKFIDHNRPWAMRPNCFVS